jgi:tripartite-type tricarboxylate transporter receptor subunit TctC
VSERLTKLWGQQVTVLNKPGAVGLLAAQAAKSSEPDGYTLYMPTSTALVILPEINPKTGLDFERDFVPIGLMGETPMAIAASTASGIGSLAELIDTAKAKPGVLLYAANARGSTPHLAGEYLRAQAGVDMTFVPYPGAAAALQDVLGARVPIVVESLSALTGAVQDNAIRVLAFTSRHRLPEFPKIPTASETLSGFTLTGWFALLAPRQTPEAVIHKVSVDLRTVLGEPAIRQKLSALGVYARPMSAVDTADFIRRERETWRPVIRKAGLTAPQ